MRRRVNGYMGEGPKQSILEHRLVAEEILGRELRAGETVHHINGERADNRPENLVVFPTIGAHLAYHNAKKPSYDHWQGKAIFLADHIEAEKTVTDLVLFVL